MSNQDAINRRLEQVCASISEYLDKPTRYPAVCLIDPILKDARSLDPVLLLRLESEVNDPHIINQINRVRQFIANPQETRENAITRFIESELDRWGNFFDVVKSKTKSQSDIFSTPKEPLTPEQRKAIVTDEDATLVLAGAGSGKTTVITSKAAYLVKSELRTSEEILLLAFTRNAAKEMSDRIFEHIGIPVEAKTFHALGLDIIGTVEGTKPVLAKHASDRVAYCNLIEKILWNLMKSNEKHKKAINCFLSRYFHDSNVDILPDKLRTLQGELVKSQGEVKIANWLYENGIAYEYEPVYEHKVSTSGRRDYQPDFRLKESGIYIEHFGIYKTQDGDEITAENINTQDYLESRKWKREIHKKHKTILIETYDHELKKSSKKEKLSAYLSDKIKPHGVKCRPRTKEQIDTRKFELEQVSAFSWLLGTFLRKFKSRENGNYTESACYEKSVEIGIEEIARAFLPIFSLICEEYEKHLKNEDRIDFEDMINRATRHIENGIYPSPFRHILIDEFQDISQSCARLVNALRNQSADTRIFAVGDDWQSIYRFTGADIHLMNNFGVEFGGAFNNTPVACEVDLKKTFRSVSQIASAARRFVLQNPNQKEKEIIPTGSIAEISPTESGIIILMTNHNTSKIPIKNALSLISAKSKNSGTKTSVLLLGRYNALEPSKAEIAKFEKQFPRLNIEFKTIHKAKGLEADHVILLSANSGKMGLPSEIADNPLLNLVSLRVESYPNAEERRVMYVAMTRARYTMTILASKSNPSSFVTELIESPACDTTIFYDNSKAYRCEQCGRDLKEVTGKNGRNSYRCSQCKNFLPACPSCQSALPRSKTFASKAVCSCGAIYESCPKCVDGWLVKKNGRRGQFLSCVRPSCKFTKTYRN